MPEWNLFLSWSGETSRAVAVALREWLPVVIQQARPWMSDEDLAKGSHWSSELSQRLKECRLGVLCLTPDNLESAWLMFEAGALSKTLGEALVCPYLFGLKPTDFKGPLTQFQAAEANREGTLRLCRSINAAFDSGKLSEPNLDRIFKSLWPELESTLKSVHVRAPAAATPRRDPQELLEEILENSREQAKLRRSSDQALKLLAKQVSDLADALRQVSAPAPPVRLEAIRPEGEVMGSTDPDEDARDTEYCNTKDWGANE